MKKNPHSAKNLQKKINLEQTNQPRLHINTAHTNTTTNTPDEEYKKRRAQKQKKITEQLKQYQYNLLNPPIKDKKITWKISEKKRNTFEGYINDDLLFIIEKKLLSFNLDIKNKDIIEHIKKAQEEKKWKINILSSTHLLKLQHKAEVILKETINH